MSQSLYTEDSAGKSHKNSYQRRTFEMYDVTQSIYAQWRESIQVPFIPESVYTVEFIDNFPTLVI